MFESLLYLPLFQGFSTEQLTQLIETVGMDFQKYNPGDVIMSRGRECKHLRLLVSGKVKLESQYFGGTVVLSENLVAPNVLLPNFLYGLHTQSPATVSAVIESGVLQFEKQVFEQLLRNYPIMQINYLNILSLRSQQLPRSMMSSPELLEERFLAVIRLMIQRGSTQVLLESPRANLADVLNIPRLAFYNLLEDMVQSGKIRLGRGKIEFIGIDL